MYYLEVNFQFLVVALYDCLVNTVSFGFGVVFYTALARNLLVTADVSTIFDRITGIDGRPYLSNLVVDPARFGGCRT